MRKVDFLLLLAVASLVILVVPIAGALYETKTDDEGIYTLSNLPSGTYTITAVAFAPKWVPGDVKLMGKIIVVLKEGEHLEGKDIIVEEIDKKLNTNPIPVNPGEGTCSISGKVLVHEPFFKKIMPVSSELCKTRVIITGYEQNTAE